MRASELRRILVGIACASCGTAAAPQPAPVGAEPGATSVASPVAPAPEAAVSASASASTVVTAVASASAPAPPASAPARDPRAAVGPDGEVLWRVGLAREVSEKLERRCHGRTGLSVSCSVPEQPAARVARADTPVEACPKQGPVLEIRCSGCGGPLHPGGGGALQEGLTRGVRQHVPAACCYAGCVPLPRRLPPNAGRPFVVRGAPRTASLVVGAAW